MSGGGSFERVERLFQRLSSAITVAAVAYEARWSLVALRRIDPDIHGRLKRQIDLWQEASRHGDEAEMEAQGEALVRGYRRAVEVMSAASFDEDAHMTGQDPSSGLRITIGPSIASAAHVAATEPGTVHFTPDEIAALLAQIPSLQPVIESKRVWPGATVMPREV